MTLQSTDEVTRPLDSSGRPFDADIRPFEIDTVYSHLCATMTALGEHNASSFLARFALLAIERLADGEAAIELIDAAAAGISTTSAATDRPCG